MTEFKQYTLRPFCTKNDDGYAIAYCLIWFASFLQRWKRIPSWNGRLQQQCATHSHGEYDASPFVHLIRRTLLATMTRHSSIYR